MGRVILRNITLLPFNLLTNVTIWRAPPHRRPHGFRYLPCVYLRSEKPQHKAVARYHGDHCFITRRILSYVTSFTTLILSGLPTYHVVTVRCARAGVRWRADARDGGTAGASAVWVAGQRMVRRHRHPFDDNSAVSGQSCHVRVHREGLHPGIQVAVENVSSTPCAWMVTSGRSRWVAVSIMPSHMYAPLFAGTQ